jgi:hypothetical protein
MLKGIWFLLDDFETYFDAKLLYLTSGIYANTTHNFSTLVLYF